MFAIPPILSTAQAIAFNPWVFSAGVISATDLACRASTYVFPDAFNYTICQVPQNMIQGTANTIRTTIKVASSASKGFERVGQTLDKGAAATANFSGAFIKLSSKVFDIANHPYAPHICAGVVAGAAAIYTTMKVIRFTDEHRKATCQRELFQSETRKNLADVDIAKATIAKINLEAKIVEAELEKGKLEVEIKRLELKEKKLQLLAELRAKTQKTASTQTGNSGER